MILSRVGNARRLQCPYTLRVATPHLFAGSGEASKPASRPTISNSDGDLPVLVVAKSFTSPPSGGPSNDDEALATVPRRLESFIARFPTPAQHHRHSSSTPTSICDLPSPATTVSVELQHPRWSNSLDARAYVNDLITGKDQAIGERPGEAAQDQEISRIKFIEKEIKFSMKTVYYS